jgi:hypothetical protein
MSIVRITEKMKDREWGVGNRKWGVGSWEGGIGKSE